MNRLDGEGLIPRANRTEDWHTTTSKLAEEAQSANSLFTLPGVELLPNDRPILHLNEFQSDQL